MTMPQQDARVYIFISSAPEDAALLRMLDSHLSALTSDGRVQVFHESSIDAGENMQAAIAKELLQADIMLLLVSAGFLASDCCYEQMLWALERKHVVRAVPVLMRACDWHHTPLEGLVVLPRNGVPVNNWPDIDSALAEVVRELSQLVAGVRGSRASEAGAAHSHEVPGAGVLVEDVNGSVPRTHRSFTELRNDSEAQVEIEKIRTHRWIVCVSVAVVGSVLVVFFGALATFAVAAAILYAARVPAAKSVTLTKGSAIASAPASVAWVPAGVSLALAATISVSARSMMTSMSHDEGSLGAPVSPRSGVVDKIEAGEVRDVDGTSDIEALSSVDGGAFGLGEPNVPGASADNANGKLTGHPQATPRLASKAGATSVSGKVPHEVFERVVNQNIGRLRSCYEAGLRNNSSLVGRVAVRFVIGVDGTVSQVQNGGSDMPDSDVVSCVVRSFYSLSFPQPEGGVVSVTLPVSFSLSAAKGASGMNVVRDRNDGFIVHMPVLVEGGSTAEMIPGVHIGNGEFGLVHAPAPLKHTGTLLPSGP